MEEAVYLCTWSLSPEGYRLWIKQRPAVTGEGITFSEAQDKLITAIQDSGGAIRAVLEFDPPPPKSAFELSFSSPELCLITGDDSFETDTLHARPSESPDERHQRLAEIDTFFQAPVCRKCKYPPKPRSDRPLPLKFAPGRCNGAIGFIGHEGGAMIQLWSESFLDLLTSDERRALQLRPVVRPGRARKFYELTGPAGPPLVAVAGLQLNGWRCALCGHRTWGYWLDGLAAHSFIARSDLPTELPGIFTVGQPPEVQLVATAARWKTMVGRPGTRGLVSRPLGVAPDHLVIRDPLLPSYETRLRPRLP